MKNHLEQIGQFVAERSDSASDPQAVLDDVRSRLTHPLSKSSTPMARRALLAALAVAASVALFLFVPKPPGRITYEVSRVQDARQGWIETKSESARLDFSEGTRLAVRPDTRLRVSESREKGATVVLERGRLTAHVEHKTGEQDWRFHAGPYLVQVTGTEFEVGWDVSQSLFELELFSGSVIVSGPHLAQDRVVRPGEVLRVSALLSQQAPQEQAAPPEQAQPQEPAAPPEQQPVRARQATEQQQSAEILEPKSGPPALGAPLPPHRAQSQNSAPQEHQADMGAGNAPALEQASADELWQIADAARVGGQPDLAQAALLRLREHHQARGQSAYLLGKIAIDQRGSRSEAIKWFEIYMREYPNGPLTEQALGRLVELSAGTPKCQAHAREYLKRFPEGAYVPFARSQLAP